MPNMMVLEGENFGRWLGLLQKNGISVTKEILESSLAPFYHVEGTVKRRPSLNQELGPYQTPNLWAPWSWLPSLHNCRRQILAVYKTLSLNELKQFPSLSLKLWEDVMLGLLVLFSWSHIVLELSNSLPLKLFLVGHMKIAFSPVE